MIETKISLDFDGVLDLGCPGEKDCRRFEFDLSEWMEHFQPGGIVRLLAQRPFEHVSCPCVLEVGENTAVWTVSEADVQMPGKGYVQLQYTEGGSVVLSAIFDTAIGKSLVPVEGEPPEPQEPWVQTVLNAADRAENAAKRAEEAAGGGGGGVDPEYIEGIVDEYLAENPPTKGEDGYTPVRGKDYWTEDDKAEIKGYVDEAILGGKW